MQNVLMYAAVRAGDREAYEASLTARGPELAELWQRFLTEEAANDFPVLRDLEAQTGERPPDEEDPPEEAVIWEPAEVPVPEAVYV